MRVAPGPCHLWDVLEHVQDQRAYPFAKTVYVTIMRLSASWVTPRSS